MWVLCSVKLCLCLCKVIYPVVLEDIKTQCRMFDLHSKIARNVCHGTLVAYLPRAGDVAVPSVHHALQACQLARQVRCHGATAVCELEAVAGDVVNNFVAQLAA